MTRKVKKPSQSQSGGPTCFSAAGVAVCKTEDAVQPQNESAKLEPIIGAPAKINGNTLTTVDDMVKLEASNPVSNQPKLTEVKPNVNNQVTSSSNTTVVSTKAKRTHRGRKKKIKVHVLTESEATKIDSDLSADNDSDGFVLVGPSARSKPNEANVTDKPVLNMENKENQKNNKKDVTKTIENSRENTPGLSKALEDDNPNLEWQVSSKKGNRKNRTLQQIEVKNTQEEIPYQKGNCNIKNSLPSENIIEEATPSINTHLPNPKNDIPKSGKRDKLDPLKRADSDKEVISGNTKDSEIKLKPEIKNTSIQKSPGKKDNISLKKEKGNKYVIESSEKSQNIGDTYNTAISNPVTKDDIKNKEAHAEIKSAAVDELENMDKFKKKNQITEPPADYSFKPVADDDTIKIGHNPLEQRTSQESPQKRKCGKKSLKGHKIEGTKVDINTVVSNASGNTSKLTALAEIDKINEINPEPVVEKESKQQCDKLKLTQGKTLIKSVSKSNDDIVQLSCTNRSESNTSTVQIRNKLEDEDITTKSLQDAVVERKQDRNEKTTQSFEDEFSKISQHLQKQSTNPNTEEHILTQYTKTIAEADTKIEKKPAKSNKRNISKSKGTPKIEENVYSNESKDKIIKIQESNPHELSIDSLLKEIDLVDAGKAMAHEDNIVTPTSKKSILTSPTKILGTYPEESIIGQELHDLVIGVGTLAVIASTEIVPLTSTNTEQKPVKESLTKNIEITKIEDTKSATKTPKPVSTRTVEITTQIPQDKIDGSGKSPKKQKQNRKPSNNKTTTTPNQCTTPEALQTISNELSIKNNETADTIDLEIPIVQLAKLFIQEIPQRPLDLKETPNESSEFVHLTEKGESPDKTKQAKRIRNQSKIVTSLPNEICEDIESSTEIVSPVSSPENKKGSLVKPKQRKRGKPSDIYKPGNSSAIDAPQVLELDTVTESNHLEPRIDICKKHPCPSYASKLSQSIPEKKEMHQPPKESRKEVRSHDITILKGNTKSEQLINKDLKQENIIIEQTAVLRELIRENITKDVSPTILGDVLVNEDNEIPKSHLSKCENKAKIEIDEDKRKLLNLALNLIIEAAKPKSKQDENKKPLGLPTVLEVVTPEETVSQKSLESDKKIECKRIGTSADILENADVAEHPVLREPADLPERPKTPDVFTMTEKQTKGRSSNKKRQNKIDKLNAGCSTKPNQSGNPAMPETKREENDEDFIEFKFKPRTIFLANACNLCKALSNADCKLTLCQHCKMVSYCCESHRMEDLPNHQQICTVICEIASRRGGDHIYHNSKILGEDNFRNMRAQMVSICETAAKRTLQPFEREIVLFPRLCCSPNCREWRQELLENCKACGQVSFCASNQEHLSQNHATWCQPYLLFCKIVVRQHQHGRIEPALPARIFTTNYQLPNKMEEFFRDILKNNSALKDDCQLAALSQLATAPLTVLYAQQKTTPPIISDNYTIHLVGAELQFEADTLDKWEAFMLHLLPSVNYLKIIFIGPELNTENLPLDILSRIRMCKACRQTCRTVKFEFHCRKLYHEYVDSSAYTKPNIVCAFNPGLHRPMGYAGKDTWPDTIRAVLRQQVPFVVTAYTEHEIPLDLQRILNNADRPVETLLPPQLNPYASLKPDRNFISDDRAPLIFKNYYLLAIKC